MKGACFVAVFCLLAAPSCGETEQSRTTGAEARCSNPPRPEFPPELAEPGAYLARLSLSPEQVEKGGTYTVTLEGQLPTPCHGVDHLEETPGECAVFLRPFLISTAEICIQVIADFKQSFELKAPDVPGVYWISAGGGENLSALLRVSR